MTDKQTTVGVVRVGVGLATERIWLATYRSQSMADGKIADVVDIERGSILDFPKTLARLFAGANTGKQILEISG
jgi:NADPH-dependent curcumin reductase CurA